MKDIASFIKNLEKHIKGEVLSDAYTLGMYSTDASIYQVKPIVVVLPKDETDVKLAVKLADQYKITILPRGGGTSLAGQSVGKSMVLDFSKYMNQVLEINAEERWVRVQPGKVRDELNAELAKYNLHFAPDPATTSRANVGGMVGNNSSGTKSILYGKTVDHVLETRVLLTDGTELTLSELSPEQYEEKVRSSGREGEIYSKFRSIIKGNKDEVEKRFPKIMRRVGGYNLDEFIHADNWNLAKLVTGSEGTLALTLDMKLNLVPLPKYKSVCPLHFNSFLEAIGTVSDILQYQPSAVEIIDETVIKLSKENLTTRKSCQFIQGNPNAILLVEFYGETQEDVMVRPQKMVEALKAGGKGYAYPIYPEGKDYNDVWVVRKKGLGLMMGMTGGPKPLAFIEDAAVPVEHLPEYIDQVVKICAKHGTRAAMYAHASVGLIHVRPILDLRKQEDIDKLKHIANETFELVVKYGGAWSGEHGDGMVRSPWNEQFFGSQLYNAFKEVKRLFDPNNLMNPGKIVDAEPVDSNLKYGATYKDQEVATQFHYSSEGNFKESVHMCTGVGECRKLIGGTMCPSFKATRDEEHSTRGRANALRMAMSNQLDDQGLTSPRLHQALDLCLSCKACKSECPSNVDMAKMKSDVLQLYYDKHGTTLRDRLIRDSTNAAKRFSGGLASLMNAIQGSSLFRSLLDGVAGFDKRRTLPEYASEPFYKWFEKHGSNQPKQEKQVVLFADTYLNFHEPNIGISAFELLQACGYEVILANVGCCQRPKISHGFLKEAKKEGQSTLDKLNVYLSKGLKVVVCEPSCASALNDDLPDLIESGELSKQLKEQVMMIDVFLAKEMEAGNIATKLQSISGDISIHGHCHQKALYGTNTMKSCIHSNGNSVDEIPSGCCGMAGSFGYEKEHYALSEKIGESILFPKVRAMKEGTTLVANGFSCRHQIEHFTGVKPKHWVEVVRPITSNTNS